MNTSFLYRNPKMVLLGIIAIALIVTAIPLTNTLQLCMKYFALQNDIRLHRYNDIDERKVDQTEILLTGADHTKKIFEAIGNACQANHVLLKQVELPKSDHTETIIIQSQQISVEGDFVNILKSLNDILLKLEMVKIASVKFEREENNKKISLIAHIVFQSVKLPDDDIK